jgi:hypothetical protein
MTEANVTATTTANVSETSRRCSQPSGNVTEELGGKQISREQIGGTMVLVFVVFSAQSGGKLCKGSDFMKPY